MQQGMPGMSPQGQWALRLSLWKTHGGRVWPAVAALVEWFALRQVFAVADEGAFWQIAAINAAVVALVAWLTHRRVEQTMRLYASPLPQAAGVASPAYRTAAACADGACARCSVRCSAIGPFEGTSAQAIRDELAERHRAHAPMSADEFRLMCCVATQRMLDIGALVVVDLSPPSDGGAP